MKKFTNIPLKVKVLEVPDPGSFYIVIASSALIYEYFNKKLTEKLTFFNLI